MVVLWVILENFWTFVVLEILDQIVEAIWTEFLAPFLAVDEPAGSIVSIMKTVEICGDVHLF